MQEIYLSELFLIYYRGFRRWWKCHVLKLDQSWDPESGCSPMKPALFWITAATSQHCESFARSCCQLVDDDRWRYERASNSNTDYGALVQSRTNKDNNFPKPFQDVRQMLRLHFKVSKQYLRDPMDRSLQANFWEMSFWETIPQKYWPHPQCSPKIMKKSAIDAFFKAEIDGALSK